MNLQGRNLSVPLQCKDVKVLQSESDQKGAHRAASGT